MAVERLGEGPSGEGFAGWIYGGVQRHGLAFVAALLVCWGGVTTMVFLAVAGAALGALGGLLGGSLARALALAGAGDSLSSGLAALEGTAQWGTALAGAAAGFAAGPALYLSSAVAGATLTGDPVGYAAGYLGGLLPGLLLALLVLFLSIFFEAQVLHLRGTRRMSRRELERLGPLISGVRRAYGLSRTPAVLVHDEPKVQSYAHARHVVVYRGMLEQLEDDELQGVLAHEVHHWRKADGVGLAFVWACGWPVILLYDAACRVASLHPLAALFAWLLAWPLWVSVRLILVPLVGRSSREHEYEADRAAVEAGYGEGLYRALEEVRELEPGRSGWEQTVAATHPPTELRLEAIEGLMARQEARA